MGSATSLLQLTGVVETISLADQVKFNISKSDYIQARDKPTQAGYKQTSSQVGRTQGNRGYKQDNTNRGTIIITDYLQAAENTVLPTYFGVGSR